CARRGRRRPPLLPAPPGAAWSAGASVASRFLPSERPRATTHCRTPQRAGTVHARGPPLVKRSVRLPPPALVPPDPLGGGGADLCFDLGRELRRERHDLAATAASVGRYGADANQVSAAGAPLDEGRDDRGVRAEREEGGARRGPGQPPEEGHEHAGAAPGILVDQQRDDPVPAQRITHRGEERGIV